MYFSLYDKVTKKKNYLNVELVKTLILKDLY